MNTQFARNLVAGGTIAILAPIVGSDQPLAAQSPTAVLRGYVRDNAHRPIAGAKVEIVGASITTVADSSGCYSIDQVPPGAHTVRASFVGYRPRGVEGVVFVAGDTVTKDFVLAETPVEIGAAPPRDGYTDRVPRSTPRPGGRGDDALVAPLPGVNERRGASSVTGVPVGPAAVNAAPPRPACSSSAAAT
jgi:hypothetical protein